MLGLTSYFATAASSEKRRWFGVKCLARFPVLRRRCHCCSHWAWRAQRPAPREPPLDARSTFRALQDNCCSFMAVATLTSRQSFSAANVSRAWLNSFIHRGYFLAKAPLPLHAPRFENRLGRDLFSRRRRPPHSPQQAVNGLLQAHTAAALVSGRRYAMRKRCWPRACSSVLIHCPRRRLQGSIRN